MSDFQVGMWLDNESTVRRAVARAIEERPAFVLLLGDYVYKAEDAENHIGALVDLVRPLSVAGIPTFAVLGSHDYGIDNDTDPKNEQLVGRLVAGLESVEVRILHNEAVELAHPQGAEEPLFLVGIGSKIAQEAHPAAALADLPASAPRVVLMHNPDTFATLPAGTAPLALAGHTHGGQIRLPFMPGWSWMSLVQEGEVRADGWISDYGNAGNKLYVNRGVGFSKVPIRINCPPELTLFTLQSD
jgi:predicted MPP superfamily phosphohydrolase